MTAACLLIDYQNVHLSAWECFTRYGTPVKEAQIHPVSFANQTAKKRTETLGPVDITRIVLFRGIPNPRKEPTLNAVVTRQHNAWRSDSRVEISSRPLRYLRDWPDRPAEEKGVDVLLAITLVQSVLQDDADVHLVASRDTDLLPAIELAQKIRPGSVEIVSWFGQSDLSVAGVPNHVLGEAAYRASRDPRDYGAQVRRR